MSIERIKKNNPILLVLDDCFFEEFGVTIEDLWDRDRTRFVQMCRTLYTQQAHSIAKHLTTNELGILIKRHHATIIWQLKQHNGWLEFDKEYQRMYTRLQNKFNQLKRKKENGME